MITLIDVTAHILWQIQSNLLFYPALFSSFSANLNAQSIPTITMIKVQMPVNLIVGRSLYSWGQYNNLFYNKIGSNLNIISLFHLIIYFSVVSFLAHMREWIQVPVFYLWKLKCFWKKRNNHKIIFQMSFCFIWFNCSLKLAMANFSIVRFLFDILRHKISSVNRLF